MRAICIGALAFLSAHGSAVTAQAPIYLPASQNPNTNELNSNSGFPFEFDTARAQVFYAAAEVGSSTLVAQRLSFRYDSKAPKLGGHGPFTIQRLRVFVGATPLGIDQLSAVYAANFPTPPTLGFDRSMNFLNTPGPGQGPYPWGAQNGQFIFAMMNPIPVVIPPGGCLGVELLMENSNGQNPTARLDTHRPAVGGIVRRGTVSYDGAGCPTRSGYPFAPLIRFESGTQFAPGTAVSVSGEGYGANAPVLTILGTSTTNAFGTPLPFTIPGTNPPCMLYVSPDIWPALITVADAGGRIIWGQPGSYIAIPKSVALNGATYFIQNLTITPPWSGNPHGVALTGFARIDLGIYATPSEGVWLNSHYYSVGTESAAVSEALGYALRIE